MRKRPVMWSRKVEEFFCRTDIPSNNTLSAAFATTKSKPIGLKLP